MKFSFSMRETRVLHFADVEADSFEEAVEMAENREGCDPVSDEFEEFGEAEKE